MYSVHQHWDPLKVCVVGRSYPPEFYSWIKVPHVRSLFERIALETEEDYQGIIRKLQSFGVTVMRPDIPEGLAPNPKWGNGYEAPPMTPRDFMVMIGENFYYYNYWTKFYDNIKDPSWESYSTAKDFFAHAPQWQQDEVLNVYDYNPVEENFLDHCYQQIFNHISAQGNQLKHNMPHKVVNGAMVSRIGRDLYFGTQRYDEDQSQLKGIIDQEFTQTRNHIVNTGGHSDGTYCPVAPGLIVSLRDVPEYKTTFPGWEVVYLPPSNWTEVKEFVALKEKNAGRWWIPGFEHDQEVIDVVDTWLNKWTGYVEETVFDVNMLIVDPKNVIAFSYNKQVFDALARYGITAHVVPFRHRYFWDGGIHCVTLDLHREGVRQDFFPGRT
jgi:hypothetical protein